MLPATERPAFNPRATRGARKATAEMAEFTPSTPSRCGANVKASLPILDDSLQPPRDAGRTRRLSTKAWTCTFHAHARRGAQSLDAQDGDGGPSNPEQCGAHGQALDALRACLLQPPRNAGRWKSGRRRSSASTLKPRALRSGGVPGRLRPTYIAWASTPAKSGAHPYRRVHTMNNNLQPPRNAGRTETVTTG